VRGNVSEPEEQPSPVVTIAPEVVIGGGRIVRVDIE
jgi:hypothetical protein